MKTNIYIYLGGPWGGGGGLTSNSGLTNFQDSETSSQSRHMYNKGEKINTSFSYISLCAFLAIWGRGPGWPTNSIQFNSIHLFQNENPYGFVLIKYR